MNKYRWGGRGGRATNDASPSDDAIFQIVELNELPKAAGVVIL